MKRTPVRQSTAPRSPFAAFGPKSLLPQRVVDDADDDVTGAPTWYTDADIAAREREVIFARNWLCVGLREQVAKPGDYATFEIAGESLLIVRGDDGKDRHVDLDEMQAEAQVLNDDEIRAIADIAVRSERHAGCPQDTEWAIADGTTYIVQTRPITTLNRAGKPAAEQHEVLLQGLPAVPGAASGEVRVLMDDVGPVAFAQKRKHGVAQPRFVAKIKRKSQTGRYLTSK
jgi:hypothetical protein